MADHSPNTSELSKPHESRDHPFIHVDNIHYGSNGQQDRSLRVDGISDSGSIQAGQYIYDLHQEDKKSSDDSNRYSEPLDNYGGVTDGTPDDPGGNRK